VNIAIESLLPVERGRVFAALVDPAILQRCIPGCEELVETAPDTYAAKLKVGVAGLKGSYGGNAVIRDRRPPESLTLGFDGKGGPGFVRGSAVLRLSDRDGGTHVACDAEVHVGGLIAAIGSRLVEAAAKKLAADFFQGLARELKEPAPGTR
jgi:carbon monoxide dehydrogenase subunit G